MILGSINYLRSYLSIGFFNTVLHWLSFLTIHYWLDFNQASSNLLSFSIAVTFSFFMNARYTFKTQATWRRYLLFVSFMGLLSFTTGYFSEKMNFFPIITLVLFSMISLIIGFLCSSYIVFKEKDVI